jgi:nicotinamide-nucleotide amidase
MISIELLTIGHELLDGRVVNKNESTISQFLLSKGLHVKRSLTIGDYIDLISDSIKESVSRSDVLIITGGLGPTQDDITRDAIAKAAGTKLVLSLDAMKQIESYYTKSSRDMPESNKKQAYFPEGAEVLSNDQGTAPSFYLTINNCLIVSLPGVPRELHPILENRGIEVIYEHLKMEDKSPKESLIKCFGIGESAVQDMLDDLYPLPDGIELSFQSSVSEVWINILTMNTKLESFYGCEKVIKETLSDYIFSTDKRTLIDHVAEYADYNKLSISIAESCTGGLVSKMITDRAGASSFFNGGVISYSNSVKRDVLGVSNSILKTYGAVSAQCAEAMAVGVRKKTNSNIGLSITGIAGPDGGTDEKPVGTVFIGYTSGKATSSVALKLSGSRDRIRLMSVYWVLLTFLKEHKQ